MAYCDHKTTGTCNDCVEEIVRLRKRVKRLEAFIRDLASSLKIPESLLEQLIKAFGE